MAEIILPNPVSTYKQCPQCGIIKPLTEFHNDKKRRDGRVTKCKECICASVRQYTAERHIEINNKRRVRYAVDATYSETIKARGLRYRSSDRDRYNANVRQWRSENREKYIESNRNWQIANPERYRQSIVAWERANAEKVALTQRNAQHRRRVRLSNVRCDFTIEQWENIKAFYCGRCAFCNKKTKLTMDHVKPVSKGGEHTAANIIPLCGSCNCRKFNHEGTQTFQPHLYMV